MITGAVVLTGCAIPEAASTDDLLEPLHGPVTPDVLTPQAAAPVAPPPEPTSDATIWRISNVLDGRTLEVYQGLERATATLGGITVPTGDECLARLATDSLAFITGGGRPFEIIPSTARDGRIDGATVLDDNGDDLASVMLSLGLARVGDDAAPDRAAIYVEIEATARESAEGIWSDECNE